ncbi:MAG: hypothetical protein ABUL58_07870 [Steroidobacter sp.]
MIATPQFVFLHLHKSGGTFVNECLFKHFSQAILLGYHLPRRLIPPPYVNLPVIGLVRNPWSYYVSWFSYQSARPQANALFRILSRDKQLDFKDTISNMLRLGDDIELLGAVVQALPRLYTNAGLNLPGHALAGIADSGMGFYSYLYQYMYGDDNELLRLGRMENLRTDLLNMLNEIGVPVDQALRDHILNEAPVNVSSHAYYAEYYDDELRDLVAERDALILARHGYHFGG